MLRSKYGFFIPPLTWLRRDSPPATASRGRQRAPPPPAASQERPPRLLPQPAGQPPPTRRGPTRQILRRNVAEQHASKRFLDAGHAMPRLRSQTRVTGMGIPLPPDLVGRCLESLPFEDVHTDVKQVSKEVRLAARRSLTRGRWRPVKLFCEQGLAALSGDTPPSSDQTKAMLRSAWATEPSVVLLEIASWPAMRPAEGELHANYLDATIRFLDVVEPSLDGIGRVIAAFGPETVRSGLRCWRGWSNPPHIFAGKIWIEGLLCQWFWRAARNDGESAPEVLFKIQPDLGLHAWKDPRGIASVLIKWGLTLNGVVITRDNPASIELRDRIRAEWQDSSETQVLLQVFDEAPVWREDYYDSFILEF